MYRLPSADRGNPAGMASEPVQFHILSFEGPDPYSRAGGIATRVEGLTEALAGMGFETHLWFIGDPDLPGHETRGNLHLHRWAQWVSNHHPAGVYDGEFGKRSEYATSLPPYLVREQLLPHLAGGGQAVVLAEEWHTADAVIHLHALLEEARVRDRVAIFWNANNTFGFEHIAWERLARAAVVTTVSRYMKHHMRESVSALVIPNGLAADTFDRPDPQAIAELRRRHRGRTIVAKMARWDPAKRWLDTVGIVAAMKQAGWRPLFIARGGTEPHGEEVLAAMRERGLRRVDRQLTREGAAGLIEALRDIDGADVVNLRSHVDADSRRLLFRGAAAVMANSDHEPFGLVGLETMAAGGVACTGCSGEDYAISGQNAIVLETGDPREFMTLFYRLRTHPQQARAIRRAGQWTARRFAWPEVIERVLFPRMACVRRVATVGSSAARRVREAPAG
jgi:glycosyltransferase involved in cell wall biosynthesis